ncbi:hypothetical protein [Enterobacter phage 04_vB_Eclo_IJM]|nr:hypothetical protein [Enterobacter phage 04_vB_Eclo_IJM]
MIKFIEFLGRPGCAWLFSCCECGTKSRICCG